MFSRKSDREIGFSRSSSLLCSQIWSETQKKLFSFSFLKVNKSYCFFNGDFLFVVTTFFKLVLLLNPRRGEWVKQVGTTRQLTNARSYLTERDHSLRYSDVGAAKRRKQ